MKKYSVILFLLLALPLFLTACSGETVAVGDIPVSRLPTAETSADASEAPAGITKSPSMADIIAGTTEAPAEDTPEPSMAAEEAPVSIAADYNIGSGLDILTAGDTSIVSTDHFTMQLPSLPWSAELVSSTILQFCYNGSVKDGYEGIFLTIYAFPQKDNSFTSWPNYSYLGEKDGIKYIAALPTDLQYNPQDSTQAQEYNLLLDAAKQFEIDDPNCTFTLNP